jgi:two-component system, NtrC family, response regulator AtoC
MATVASMAAISRSTGPIPPISVVFGSSPRMQQVLQRIEKIAAANVPVLIHGESGTGKDIIARLIHEYSPWKTGPFVRVNCPAIPGTLLESELFGYEKGAFTGAMSSKPGRVEMAHRGTLFLDEITELEHGLQSKLLQLLQDGQFCRIGAQDDKKVEARVVCATNRSLEREVEQGTFRQDLFYRINVVNLPVPPLRERSCDVPMLTSYFLEIYNDKYNCRAKPLSAEMLTKMQRYYWPGNIRELENLIRRYVILGSEDAITAEMTARRPEITDFEVPLDGALSLKKITRKAVREIERRLILRVLEANNWNRKKAARALSISYRALLYKIREAELPGHQTRTVRMPEGKVELPN